MSRTVGKKNLTLRDIWQAYVNKLLKENPEWWARVYNYIPRCKVYAKVDNKVIEMACYIKFRKVIEQYLERARAAIINGEALNIGSGVGKICGRRIQRDFRKKTQQKIDWYKTKRLPNNLVWNEEKKKMVYKKKVYFTTDDWCRIAWHRFGMIRHETVYEFAPTTRNSKGETGFKMEFSQAQTKDPLLKYKYIYNPIIV